MRDYNVYDQQGNLLTDYDLSKGKLINSSRTVFHDAIEAIEEQWHWETVAEYPNGGKDIRKVIDVKGVKGKDAWMEEIATIVYVPYTPEELEAIESENSADFEERISELEEALEMILSGVTE